MDLLVAAVTICPDGDRNPGDLVLPRSRHPLRDVLGIFTAGATLVMRTSSVKANLQDPLRDLKGTLTYPVGRDVFTYTQSRVPLPRGGA